MSLHPSSRETATRALRALIPYDSLLWLDASTLSFGNGDLVDVWPDMSGNSNNTFQSDIIFQPKLLKYGSDSSLPGVLFDGNKTFLSNMNQHYMQSFVILVQLQIVVQVFSILLVGAMG